VSAAWSRGRRSTPSGPGCLSSARGGASLSGVVRVIRLKAVSRARRAGCRRHTPCRVPLRVVHLGGGVVSPAPQRELMGHARHLTPEPEGGRVMSHDGGGYTGGHHHGGFSGGGHHHHHGADGNGIPSVPFVGAGGGRRREARAVVFVVVVLALLACRRCVPSAPGVVSGPVLPVWTERGHVGVPIGCP
jgi:hypothetical protein